ncbi:carboxypeptidase-like regulatory domain-containing protein [Acidicapsa ligni]|uniref:carboxypeptidase-like regulatory domain-containing protein n=1 Tax=Acidicapsa ligni TaxID=542300 RepID=UPI0021E07538|nr:carboxypeptidase-like regulatory domain-containing protein [Acidicapsa ligni]
MPVCSRSHGRSSFELLRRWLIAAALFGALATALSAFSEPSGSDAYSTGSLDGHLTDWHSVPLVQAVVVVRNLATGAAVRTITGKNGSYKLTGLAPGEYRIEAEVPQLGKGQVEGILISAGHATRVQAALVMELPQINSTIQVDTHDLDTVSPAVTTMIAGDELNAVPLSGRNWQAMITLTPGASSASQAATDAGGNTGKVSPVRSVSSESNVSNIFMTDVSDLDADSSIDGIENTPAFSGSNQLSRGGQTLGASGSSGSSGVMTLESRTGSARAGGGEPSGSPLNIATQHGGSWLHGQAFYLNRQSLWGAQNPYTQRILETATATGIDIAQFTPEPYTPPNSRQTFGLGIGRNSKHDKLFWFAALDGLLSNDPAIATVRHPDDFFAQPTIPELTVLGARLGITGPDLIEQEVAGYSGFLEQMTGLLGTVPRTTAQIQGFARLDWHVGEHHHLSVEGNASDANAPGGALTRSSETYGSHSFGNSSASQTWGLVKWDSFLTPNLLNDAAVQFGRYLLIDSPQSPSAFEAPLISNTWGELPEIVADSKYGFILGKPAQLGKSSYPDERSYRVQDMMSWVRGKNLLKLGGSVAHISDATNTLINQTGTYSYADVLNLASDVASFTKYGLAGIDNPFADQHNCDATGKARAVDGVITGLGYLPCYAWYSQRIGPAQWHLSTNDMAGFATEQWQPRHNLTFSAGVRVETEQLPPPIAFAQNPDLAATQKLPGMTMNWGPRFGIAWAPFSSSAGKATVLRVGAGLYYGRIDNSSILSALTQTGSPKGDLNFFFKPTDAGAPPFPYAFSTQPVTVVKPGAVSFAPRFRPQEVDQAIVSLEQQLPGHWVVQMSGMASLGRRLPISIDTNLIDTNLNAAQGPGTITYSVVDALQAGPIKTPTITVPFYFARLNPNYQQLSSIEDRANSTYEAAMIKVVRYGGHGLSLHAHYIYAHATDWNPNESGNVAVDDVLDPQDFRQEYGTSNIDIRHSAQATVLFASPWKLHHLTGDFINGWNIAALTQYRSGLPFTMRTSGYIPGFYDSERRLIEGVGPGMNGSGGDNRVYGIGRNTYRYPATYTADARLGKRFHLARQREVELLAESFNLFNHQNVTLLETTGYILDRGSTSGSLPTLNFLTGLTTGSTEFGKPLDVNATNFYRQREIQLGLRVRF